MFPHGAGVGRGLLLLDWRRRVTELYARVRAAPDPAAGHARWRAGRDELFATHPCSPLPDRGDFRGLDVVLERIGTATCRAWACPLPPAGTVLAAEVGSGRRPSTRPAGPGPTCCPAVSMPPGVCVV